MCRFCWILSAALFVGVVSMGYMFGIKGNVAASDDGRTSILLTAGERDLVLSEMRVFLESVQAITMGVVNKDMKSIAATASKVGMASAAGVPASLMGKLPLEFKQLGMKTHQAFDGLSQEAQDIGDPQVILAKLGEMLNNCTTCHASYRFDVEDSKGQ